MRETSEHVLVCKTAGRTKQSFKEECDINQIMKQWERTGVLTHENVSPPVYGDFSNASSYLDARQAVIDAQRAFDSLPSATRDRMDNDPAKLLAFLEDDSNNEEAVKLGLRKPPEKPSKKASVSAEDPPPPQKPATTEGDSPSKPAASPVSGGD